MDSKHKKSPIFNSIQLEESISGVCQNVDLDCDVDYESGLCPGDSSVQCCRSISAGSNLCVIIIIFFFVFFANYYCYCCNNKGNDNNNNNNQPQQGGTTSCTYMSNRGQCIDMQECVDMGGKAFSSRANAQGCEDFEDEIRVPILFFVLKQHK